MSPLPSDILIDVLLLLDDINQLSNVVSTSKHSYSTFQGRRSLILGRVFEKQISKQLRQLQNDFPISQQGAPGWIYVARVDKIIHDVNLVLGRSRHSKDVLTLDSAAWRAMMRSDCRTGILRSFGIQSILRCIHHGRRDLAIVHTMEMLDFIIEDNLLRVDSSTGQISNKSMKNSILQLAKLLNDAGLAQTSQDMLLQLHNASPVFFDRDLFSMLLTSSRESPEAMESLIPFCQSQLDQSRLISSTDRNMTQNHNPVPYYFRWVRCLTTVHIELEQFDIAVRVFTETSHLPTCLRAEYDGLYVSLAQYLIKHLKKQGSFFHMLTVRRHVFEYLRPLQPTDNHLYAECAKDYAAQLCVMGANRQALMVLAQLKETTQQLDGQENQGTENQFQDPTRLTGRNCDRSACLDQLNDVHEKYGRRQSVSIAVI